ncbi:hypothetical protein U5801_18915 [Lamprobacter modestohalophilus]|uniref:hypothetical protein n=1 Tax=Lamprobacter modestohalophilus TaxID=1064514 RepID=UPI002ADEBC44|nr:hypothetical protein [Lamprobacter modestohalophilus]MEA1051860.1 hypothetical protein [Lamprobacter modestohalophilus]
MSRAEQGMQRQRHGVAKNLAEGIGGLIVGAALVVLASQWLKRRRKDALATDHTDADADADAEIGSADQSAPATTDTKASHSSGSDAYEPVR